MVKTSNQTKSNNKSDNKSETETKNQDFMWDIEGTKLPLDDFLDQLNASIRVASSEESVVRSSP